MHGWRSSFLVTIGAVIVGTPSVRVAIARDQPSLIKESRGAAIITVIVIAMLWDDWVLGVGRTA